MEILINKVLINYSKSGNSGHPVILMHGWGQNNSMMKPIEEHLSENFVVYNLDLPGFGASGQLSEVWGVQEYTAMLKEFIEKLSLHNPIIIAHSFGVRIALLYAADNDVYKMVLTGGAGILPKRSLMYYLRIYTFKTLRKTLELFKAKKLIKRLQKHFGSSDYKELNEVMRQSFVKIVNLDLSDKLKDISAETLLVWGENDDATPLWMGKKMEEGIKNSGLAIFENDGHYAYFNQMPRFLSVIDIFLKEDKL